MQDQDREYQESLAIDRAKKRSAAALEDAERREQQEAAEATRAAAANAAATAERAAAEAAAAAAALPEEPAQGAPGPVSLVQLQLPTGRKVRRRFATNDATVAHVALWAEAEGFGRHGHRLTTPDRQMLDSNQHHKTLAEAGLVGRIALIVTQAF